MTSKSNEARRALLALLVTAASGIAQAARPNDEAARDAAVQWVQLVDAGRYEEAASQGSQEIRAFEQWLNHVKTRRAMLGRMNQRRVIEIKRTAIVSGVPEVRRYYVIRFKTSFASKTSAIEEIALTKIGCCWEIFDYKISDQ